MRRTRWILGAAIAAVGLPLLAVLAAETLTVQVQETKLRSAPKFWAPSLATLHAGDAVSELSRQDAWIRAHGPSGQEGWVHESAVTRSQLHLTGGTGTAASGTSADEVALAGKGFTEDVEREYRQSHGNGFEALDSLPPPATDAELETFLRQGKLADWAGR
jgi:Bacterial SH3 domain